MNYGVIISDSDNIIKFSSVIQNTLKLYVCDKKLVNIAYLLEKLLWFLFWEDLT